MLVTIGSVRVICGAVIQEIVPRWMKEQNVTGGWLTAEYSMLPCDVDLFRNILVLFADMPAGRSR
jgi:ribonuclease PH